MATAQASSAAPASSQSKPPRSPMGIIFLTIFLDLVGFSIIFPLFPAMLKYYFSTAQQGGWLSDTVNWLQHLSGGTLTLSVEVLFGGLLGSLYAMLQFFFSPFWGKLSDRLGRRTVLLGTVAGTALSYLLWIFAGKFWMLLLARGLGGMMAGNISVSSAAIADITTPEKRSRGLALVGMAFGLGFIVGPALGAWLSVYDLTQKFPGGVAFGLNPFSACALAAFAMAMVNYFWVLLRFPETLPQEKRAAAIKAEPGVTPLQSIFHTDRPAIRRANMVNLYYTIAFSGMEFTLTFLAAERFAYKSVDMVKIFLFMGFMLVVVIGAGRKMVPRWGEKRSSIIGLAFGVAGFLVLAFAPAADSLRFIFYIGLFIFSISAGLTSICLPSLVSLYTDAKSQGHQIGTARAAQALGRAIGPIFFAVIYFWAGSKMSYTAGAVALLLPIWMAYKLPAPRKDSAPATAVN